MLLQAHAAAFAADDASDAREKVKNILEQARFTKAPKASTTTASMPQFSKSAPSPAWLELVAWIIVIAVVAAALVFLVIAVVKWLRGPKKDRRSKNAREAKPASPDPAIETDLGSYEDERDIDVLLAAAQRALADGNPSLAIRLRFRAGLLQLDDLGRLEFLPTLTTRAVDQAIGSSSFHSIGVAFDQTAYGTHLATADEYHESDRAWSAVLTESVGQ